MTLRANAPTLRSLLFTLLKRGITSTTGGYAMGNATDVFYARWSPYSFYPRRNAVVGLSPSRSMGRTKRTGFSASTISRSLTCRLLPEGLSQHVRDQLWRFIQTAAATIRHIPRMFRRKGLRGVTEIKYILH